MAAATRDRDDVVNRRALHRTAVVTSRAVSFKEKRVGILGAVTTSPDIPDAVALTPTLLTDRPPPVALLPKVMAAVPAVVFVPAEGPPTHALFRSGAWLASRWSAISWANSREIRMLVPTPAR